MRTKLEPRISVLHHKDLSFVGPDRVAVRRFDALRVYDLATGAQVTELKPIAGDRAIVVGGRAISGKATLAGWDLATRKKVVSFKGHTKDVRALAGSPDGRRLVTASHDGTARVWSCADGTQLARLELPKKVTPVDVAFGPDSQTVYVTADDGVLRCFGPDATPRGERKLDPKVGGTEPRVAAGADGRVVTVERARRVEELRPEPLQLSRGTARVAALTWPTVRKTIWAEVHNAVFSHDAEWLAAAVTHHFGDGLGTRTVEVWRGPAAKHAWRIPILAVDELAFAPDRPTLAMLSFEGVVVVDLDQHR